MRLMRLTTGVAALALCVGCATTGGTGTSTYPDDRPVGTTGTNEPAQVQGDRAGVVPVGQEIDVRLQTTLSSATAEPEQRFTATTAVDLMQGDRVLIPAGSTVRGIVSSVSKAGNIDRTGRLTLAFDQITVNGREHDFRGMATEAFQSGGIRDEVGTVGAAGAVGAIVGGIIGAGVGSGGVIAATEGKDIELPAGTIVRVRVDTPLRIR